MSRVFGPRLRVGVVVPPANTAVEAELPGLLPPGGQCYFTRLPVGQGGLLDRLAQYNESLTLMASSFGGLELDVLYLACTGSSYLVGAANEFSLAERMRPAESVTALTAAGAIKAELEHLGATGLVVVSPYPDELTDLAVALWENWGFTVKDVVRVPTQTIYDTPVSEVLAAVRQARPGSGDVVLISGTGLPSIEALPTLKREFAAPVLSSTYCVAQWLTRWVEMQDARGTE